MTIASDVGLGIFLVGSILQDVKDKRISCIWLLINIPVAVLISYISGTGFLYMFCGSLVGVVLLVFSFLSRDRVGRGDALVVFVMGIYLGLRGCFFCLLLALFMSALFGAGLVILRKKSPKTHICFIPFLCEGCVVACAIEYLERIS